MGVLLITSLIIVVFACAAVVLLGLIGTPFCEFPNTGFPFRKRSRNGAPKKMCVWGPCKKIAKRELISHVKFSVLRQAGSNHSRKPSSQLGPGVLNCRVRSTRDKKDDSASEGPRFAKRSQNGNPDIFIVEICGLIHAPSDMHDATLRISITDITDGIPQAKPVRARLKQWQGDPSREKQRLGTPAHDSPAFCYTADLGKLLHKTTILSDWTAVAQLSLDWLMFPRKGERNLQLSTSILSRGPQTQSFGVWGTPSQSGEELACAECTTTCENPNLGYIDLEENIQRTKTLAIGLAFVVSAADNKLFNCEIELIKNWARGNVDLCRASNKARHKLEKALNKAIVFFRDGNQLNTYKICKEIVKIAPVAGRYDVLELCLHVAQAKGCVTAEELAILKNLANWLEVDMSKFRAMMEKILPISMHEVKDVETILGVTSDMSKEEARQQLNKEYIKWNSRVVSSDPEIQTRADQVLELIAKARSEYIGLDI